ncbi:hypothetical protein [Photorhabdus sp. S14-60]|nr:hypothetical protein [Photorhabdus sp. S14-60]NDK94375.1 hypothetical protein [Photorhabdus laumondii subsp. laumondii]
MRKGYYFNVGFAIFNRICTLWISRCFAARERIPGSIDNDVTGVSECSQQRAIWKMTGMKLIIRYLYFYIVYELFFWVNESLSQ